MKIWKKILLIILIALTSVVVFYSTYPLFQIVSNYESLSPVTISGLPLFMFDAVLITLGIYGYRVMFKGLTSPFSKRFYAILCVIFSAIGAASSVVCGTWVYHNFFGPYVFTAYPFVMLLASLLLLGESIYLMVKAQNEIIKNNLVKENRSTVVHVFATLGWTLLIIFALSRAGSFLCLPNYWSTQNSIYVLPFLIQQLVPAAIVVCFLLARDVLKSKKFGVISMISIIGYSALSLTYMIVLEKVCEAETHLANSTMYINPLSTILNLERLLTSPIYFVIIYAVSLVIPAIFLVALLLKKNKK